jgi:gamma-glutamyl AIG2-like cyclotransferase
MNPSERSADALPAPRVHAFFYGSFMCDEVLARGGCEPASIEVARLSGFDIHLGPHAALVPSSEHAVYGLLVGVTNAELDRMYAIPGVGLFLPRAVLVETVDGRLCPSLCYIPPSAGREPADIEYLDRLIEVGLKYAFPSWYLARLERFRPRI